MTHNRILEILSSLGVKPLGGVSREGWLTATCPFAPFLHMNGTDHRPSFFVHVNNHGLSGFNCYTCKKRGRLSTLVRELARLREVDLNRLAITADLYETPSEFESYEDIRGCVEAPLEPLNAAAYLTMYPAAWDVEEARQYLASRGIGCDTSQVLGLLYDPDEYRIVFPVFDRDFNLYGFTGRTILEPEQYPFARYGKVKDYHGLPKRRLLLGEHLAQPGKPSWLVEGLIALAVAVEIKGRKHVNPLAPMGSRLHEEQRDRLAMLNQPVYLCFDLDVAGDDGIYGTRIDEEGRQRKPDGAVELLKGHVPVFLPQYPHDVADPDDLRSSAQIEWMLDNAECVA